MRTSNWLTTTASKRRERKRYAYSHFTSGRAHIQLHNHNIFCYMHLCFRTCATRAKFIKHEKRAVCLAWKESEFSIAHCASSNCNIFFILSHHPHSFSATEFSSLSSLFPSTTSLYCTWIILRVFTTTSLQNSIISYVRKNHDLSQWYSQK